MKWWTHWNILSFRNHIVINLLFLIAHIIKLIEKKIMKRSYQKKNQVRIKKKFLLSAFFKLACRLITIEENFSISFFFSYDLFVIFFSINLIWYNSFFLDLHVYPYGKIFKYADFMKWWTHRNILSFRNHIVINLLFSIAHLMET